MEKHIAKTAFERLGAAFGFKMVETSRQVCLRTKDTDGHFCNWLVYDVITGKFTIAGNTDHLNLWLHETRPDLTAEKLVEFNRRLNEIFAFPIPVGIC